jgi:hypothetical protein
VIIPAPKVNGGVHDKPLMFYRTLAALAASMPIENEAAIRHDFCDPDLGNA